MSAAIGKDANCANCAFAEVQPVMTPEGNPLLGETQLVCKRFPPQLVSMQVVTPNGMQVTLLPVFPNVNGEVWCYEHEPENGAQDALTN